MGNRLFTLPVVSSDKASRSPDWVSLKNRFSGKILFRSGYYGLVSGNLSLLDEMRGKWFFEELLDNAKSGNDVALVPALKKIASTSGLEESLRQRASELVEIIDEQSVHAKKSGTGSASGIDEKIGNARRLLAGTRFPQTTEILRLLRDKSPELKRLALFLIGKFNMTDMSQEVCNCLNNNELCRDAYNVLIGFGNRGGKELSRFFLESSGNVTTGRLVLKLIGRSGNAGNMSFLFDNLWANSRQYRETALAGLTENCFDPSPEELGRLWKLVYETFGTLSWLLNLKGAVAQKGDSNLLKAIDSEYVRWGAYLAGLLSLLKISSGTLPGKDFDEKGNRNLTIINELAGVVFEDGLISSGNALNNPKREKKVLKRLQRWFPSEMPDWKKALEDIINCDYNLVSNWTKACAIGSIDKLWDDSVSESVVALLFSPDDLLREEAVRLIIRSGNDLYQQVSDRLPAQTKEKAGAVTAGKYMIEELLVSKARFLISLFPDIAAEELVLLAEKILFTPGGNIPGDFAGTDSIIWSFSSGSTTGKVSVHCSGNPSQALSGHSGTGHSWLYLLPLEVVREFHCTHPDASFPLIKYIDDNEE